MLVHLDPNDLQLKVALARAALDAAEQQAATAKTAITFSAQSAAAGDTQANGGVGQAEAGVARSQDMLHEADADLERAALDYMQQAYRTLWRSNHGRPRDDRTEVP